jgi:hypothetical protein
MDKELVITNNSLYDIVNWLKIGYIVCIHAYNKKIFFYNKEEIEKITDEKIIYIDVKSLSALLNEDEWPWYIKNEKFVEYKSTNILPTEENSYYLIL